MIHHEKADLTFTGSLKVISSAGVKVEALHIDESKNVGVGTKVFGASANSVLALKNGTPPTTQLSGQVGLYSKDSSQAGNNAVLGIEQETDPEVIGVFTATHKIRVWINGVEYFLQLDAV